MTELDRVKEDPPSVTQTVAAQIRAYRLRRGWSVRQLAEECSKQGVSQLTQASLENIERGQDPTAKRKPREVTAEELLTLAYVLNARPADLLFPSERHRVQVTPQVVAHPYVAWSWLTGHVPYLAEYADLPQIWGQPIQGRGELGPPFTVYGWGNIDALLFEVVVTYQALAKDRAAGAPPIWEDEQYIGKIRRLGLHLDDFLRGGTTRGLPRLPSWVAEDLQKAQAHDLIKMRDSRSPEKSHPHTDDDGWIRTRLPRDLPTYESERPA